MEFWGLDISTYQKGIDFDCIKKAGVQFLILRAGYTGYGGDGTGKHIDDTFEDFYVKAKDRNIPVGAYWYSCANTYEKGKAEAEFMLKWCLPGKKFEYPIYIDVEDTHWQVNNKTGVTEAINGFCETLENKGYYVGVYASDISGFKDKMNIQDVRFDKWVARYGSKPQYVQDYEIWQNGSEAHIDGYSGNLDNNIGYVDYPTIIKNLGLNGFNKPEPKPEPEPEPEPIPTPVWNIKIGDDVIVNGDLYISSNAEYPAGKVTNKRTKITRIAVGTKHPYNTTGDLGWVDRSAITLVNDGENKTYTVQKGDTLSSIAAKFNTTWQELYNKNTMDRQSRLVPP